MRLRRIEAVRFGGLRDASLGALGDGLTVVYGPNEAGKSTFTALVRQVLYGYPTQREKERSYGDDPLARLVFEEDAGSWVIERVKAPHGGEVRVRTLAGADRPGLLGEITHGVSPTAFRVVFGFGVEEMAAIAEFRGSNDDILSKLYAASAGLAVSPHEVRAALADEAADLFKPRGKREVNTLVTALRGVRQELRALKAQADSFHADQERRGDLEQQLAESRAARDGARSRALASAMAAEKARERAKTLRAQEETLKELRLARKQLSDERSAAPVDAALLERAPELDAVVEESATFAASCQSLKAAEDAVLRAEAKADAAAQRTGLSAEVLAALGEGHEFGAAVDEARDDVQRLQLQCEARQAESAKLAAAAQAVQQSAGAALQPLGIAADGAGEAVADRLAAIDELESLRGGAPHDRTMPETPALVMLASGLVAIVTGLVLREWVSLGIGAALTLAGLLFVLRARSSRSVFVPADEQTYLAALGLSAAPSPIELSRLRRALENARGVLGSAAEAQARADEAVTDAGLALDALETRKALWASWLSARGLSPELTPSAAAQLLVLAREACTARLAVTEARAEAERLASALDETAARLAAAMDGMVEVPTPLTRDAIMPLVNRLKERLAAGRAAAARAEELGREIAGLDARIAEEDTRMQEAAQELRAIFEQHGMLDGGTLEDLALAAATAELAQKDAEEAFERLSDEKNQLEGRLAREAGERAGAELHLTEAGYVERLHGALDRYAVLATASRLLSDALERYERERQPEVVKHAEALYARITGGAYVGLAVPLADGPIEVFDAAAAAKTTDILSGGTGDQLYLALRLGLIQQLGQVGSGLPVLMDDVFAHFDPSRMRGAAEAVAELAAERQVVFFTCHPAIADLFAEVAPDHTRLELPRLV
jgi:uncharacterized protein YhaN